MFLAACGATPPRSFAAAGTHGAPSDSPRIERHRMRLKRPTWIFANNRPKRVANACHRLQTSEFASERPPDATNERQKPRTNARSRERTPEAANGGRKRRTGAGSDERRPEATN